MLEVQRLALEAVARRSAQAADPIPGHLFSSPNARDFFQSICEGIETFLRSGNLAGKTSEGAFLFTCLARGVREVDGRTKFEAEAGERPWQLLLPAIPTPNLGLLIVESYKQAEESTIAAYRRWIGDWPAHFIRNAEGTSEIRIKPNRSSSEDERTWSKILIFPRTGVLPKGIRAHWAHADEDPSQEFWNEVRNRVIAGMPMYRGITATPAKPPFWLRDDYGQEAAWKREIRLSVFDNQFLPEWQKEEQRAKAAVNPLERAVLYGEYVNLANTNPWAPQRQILDRWLEQCCDPIREEQVLLPIEVEGETSLEVQAGMGTVFIWEDPLADATYLDVGDASLGHDPKVHDPCGCGIIRLPFRGQRAKLVARYNGYCGAYALGHLMALLGERYNDALADPDVTGGYGRPTLRGLMDYKSNGHPNGYQNVNRDRRIDDSGLPYSSRLGFNVTADAKADLIESMRWALIRDALEVPSASAVRCLLAAEMDATGRLVKPAGIHYEDFHILARACQLMLDRPQDDAPPPREDKIEQALREAGIRGPILRPGPATKRGRFAWTRSS